MGFYFLKIKAECIMNGYPRLYMCRAAQEFKKRMSLRIIQVTKDSITEFLDYYTNIPTMNTPLVIEDLYTLSFDCQSRLLKFIEDTNLKIILLSSEDNIIPTVLSRMSLVYKVPEQVYSDLLPPTQARPELDKIDSDTYYLDYVKKQRALSPITYYNDLLVRGKYSKNKLLQLLEK